VWDCGWPVTLCDPIKQRPNARALLDEVSCSTVLYNPATLTGAIDVIVVRQKDGI